MKDYISLSKAEYELVMQALNHAQGHCQSLVYDWRNIVERADAWSKKRDQYVKLHDDLKARQPAE